MQPIATPTHAQMEALGVDPERFARVVRFTAPFDMGGHLCIVLPAGFTTMGKPVAVPPVGGRLQETKPVRAGMAFERGTTWHLRRPVLR